MKFIFSIIAGAFLMRKHGIAEIAIASLAIFGVVSLIF